ncbi:signal transduction histidine kinase [Microbacteriaceae bacterium SG_E_30_P1]|uniref:Signal transduction histidine kinase n=1 Tax=Antiquaquibacter oligotrophicus TaxID=2880260 RepID=A0ABT6KQ28_9MICO|nr:ATP-binding protein [Antiquaquibacter oligotrophicus]MDH6181969.1 signal transduction histidine kinase [Antiquaquibacter oligotrophicus]UDF12362.1 PspC domain-containing protein [Antiquaquibacter oligotrophicus]
MTTIERPALTRPRDVYLGGVCLGVAAHLGWSVRRTRMLALALAVAGGSGILLYLWLWAFVPLDPPEPDAEPAVRRRVPAAAVAIGIATVALAVVLSVAWSNDGALTAALLATTFATGVAVAWSLGFDRHDPRRSARYGLWVRGLAVGILAVAGIIALLARPTAINAVIGVGMVVLAVGVIVAPRVVALSSDLQDARTARVREEQRAEIAAHLHDSVLQTLALIQNRAGASSEVARIARAQERELRDWLFVGDTPTVADLATELRSVAAAIELDYPVRIDVVTAGESVENSSAALVSASREAMLNAARHAGGEVSVYLEASSAEIDVFIRDRGPGVDLDALPGDRLGIRESIIGRMSRAGGTATLRPGAGGGTEVHLHLDTAAHQGGDT